MIPLSILTVTVVSSLLFSEYTRQSTVMASSGDIIPLRIWRARCGKPVKGLLGCCM